MMGVYRDHVASEVGNADMCGIRRCRICLARLRRYTELVQGCSSERKAC